MGNDPSKRADKDEAPSPEVSSSSSQVERALPELQTRPVVRDIVSRALPVDRHWYDSAPDTPTSDLSASDTEFEREDAAVSSTARPSEPLRSHDPHGSHALESEDDGPADEDAPSSQTLHQLMHRFVQGPESLQLLVGTAEFPCTEKVALLAQCIGFEGCSFDGPHLRLKRSAEMQSLSSDMRSVVAHQTLENYAGQLREMGLRELDGEMELALGLYLKACCVSSGEQQLASQGGPLVEVDMEQCLLSPVTVKKIFQNVAAECHVLKQPTSENRIALIADAEASKTEKVIQKGELVWRRLQHWSTNVRKEKKFNIWAKGLPEQVKERILKIALEIGFETAAIQQNGNIHLEIKPPEGQHRRKLKHATDELRKELEPIDEAVCQNVEQHLNEWLSDFQENGKRKDVLNCRFVLPAEWLRQTSERLASQYGLCVRMETGIELLFHHPDADLSSSQDTAPVGSDIASTGAVKKGSNKSKSNKAAKKRSPESSVKSEPGMNGQVAAAVSAGMHERSLMQHHHHHHHHHPQQLSSPPPPSMMAPFDGRMNDPLLPPPPPPPPHSRGTPPPPPPPSGNASAAAAAAAIQLPMGNNSSNARRASSRNKYDYGWDPSWPTAHPERTATTQHTF